MDLPDDQYSHQMKLEKFQVTFLDSREDLLFTNRGYSIFKILLEQISSSLNSLSINLSQYQTTESIINGNTLEELTKNFQKFHLYVQYDRISTNLLSTFRNSFWSNRQWSIDTYGNYLYTLPFHFDELNHWTNFEDISSNNWSNVKHIHLTEFDVFNSNLIKQIQLTMPRLTSMTIDSFSKFDFHQQEIETRLENVTTICFQQSVNYPIQQRLKKILPNWRNIIFRSSTDFIPMLYDQIEKLYIGDDLFAQQWETTVENYFPNVKYIEIQSNELDRTLIISKVIEYFPHSNILINFPRDWSYDSMFAKSFLNELLRDYQIIYEKNSIEFIQKPSWYSRDTSLSSEIFPTKKTTADPLTFFFKKFFSWR